MTMMTLRVLAQPPSIHERCRNIRSTDFAVLSNARTAPDVRNDECTSLKIPHRCGLESRFVRMRALGTWLGTGFAYLIAAAVHAYAKPIILNPDSYQQTVEVFNRGDNELTTNAISNARAWDWMQENIPWFDCSDKEIQEIYYFRWWTYRKHLKLTPSGYIVTEFLPPVLWAGKFNSISCAAGHHIDEGRWLHNRRYLDDYIRFWFRGGGNPRLYSCWLAQAVLQRYQVTGDRSFTIDLLPNLVENFHGWEKERFDASIGLFWQEDGSDGMEVSIGGSGFRAPLNSYMIGDAAAIAAIAKIAGDDKVAKAFAEKSEQIRRRMESALWDETGKFFKVLPRTSGAKLVDVRELHGYSPWFTYVPDQRFDAAWGQLMDPKGFCAPFGPTTAEQRHPGFAIAYSGHECQWNGPSWPYSTAVTLTALANLLNARPLADPGSRGFFDSLKIYARSQHRLEEDSRTHPWIDENLNPFTGDWLSRTRLKTWRDGTWSTDKGGVERGKDYNHSTFNDIVITGLVGFRPDFSSRLITVHPLVPPGTLEYFCLDDVDYAGRRLAIVWDATGSAYHVGAGFRIFLDGKEILRQPNLSAVSFRLPD